MERELMEVLAGGLFILSCCYMGFALTMYYKASKNNRKLYDKSNVKYRDGDNT
jgi:hypothetical protein